jgi:hypothetical protein
MNFKGKLRVAKSMAAIIGLVSLITLSTVFQGCEKDDDISFDKSRFQLLEKRYHLKSIENSEELPLSVRKLKPIQSLDELEDILKSISNNFTIIEKVPKCKKTNLLSIPRLKSTTAESSEIVRITGSNSDGRMDVFLDVANNSVVDSKFYPSGLMDVFIDYKHFYGNTSVNNPTINFTVYGEIIVKVIWQGIELRRIPVTTSGYCNKNTKQGVLTSF